MIGNAARRGFTNHSGGPVQIYRLSVFVAEAEGEGVTAGNESGA